MRFATSKCCLAVIFVFLDKWFVYILLYFIALTVGRSLLLLVVAEKRKGVGKKHKNIILYSTAEIR